MIHAYDKTYLEKARTALGRMFDFAVYDLNYNLTQFFDLFLVSGVAEQFEQGSFLVLVGKSGVELAYEVLERTTGETKRIKPRYTADRSEEYWTGWALAYYQWATSLRFAEIVKYIPIRDIQALYSPYHEMDIRQFVDKMNHMYLAAKPETNLKLLRHQSGLTQKQLADLTGIPLRTIQQYEQRRKNINKTQAEYLILLARALNCDAEALLERVE